jgi:hypothetical protein
MLSSADVRFFLFATPEGDVRWSGRPTGADVGRKAGAAMRPSRCLQRVSMFGLVGALPVDRVTAIPARERCRATAFVTHTYGGTVLTIDVNTRTKHPTDITVGTGPIGVAVTPCRR